MSKVTGVGGWKEKEARSAQRKLGGLLQPNPVGVSMTINRHLKVPQKHMQSSPANIGRRGLLGVADGERSYRERSSAIVSCTTAEVRNHIIRAAGMLGPGMVESSAAGQTCFQYASCGM